MSMMTEAYPSTKTDCIGLRSAFTGLSVALLTLILVPVAALSLSYLAGGAVTSTILFVYLFALLTNGAFLLAALVLLAMALILPRALSNLTHHHA